MSLKKEILSHLIRSGDYISGQKLAAVTGKTRAAVWKAVKALENDGYIIDAVTGKGYRLIKTGGRISAEEISAYLKSPVRVIYYPVIDSTNNACKRILADSKNDIILIAADEQTAGRGRQGKSFYSPAKTGVYFSLVIRPETTLKNAVTATTAAAVAVCRAIERLTDKKPQIKWVNDVYLDEKKICGILTEAVTNFETGIVDSVIVGIGINISTENFPSDVESAGCLDADINKNELIALACDELISISAGDYSSFIDYYRTHSMVIGRHIKFIRNNLSTSATAIAIDERGGLEVELENGERITLCSGDISIKKQ